MFTPQHAHVVVLLLLFCSQVFCCQTSNTNDCGTLLTEWKNTKDDMVEAVLDNTRTLLIFNNTVQQDVKYLQAEMLSLKTQFNQVLSELVNFRLQCENKLSNIEAQTVWLTHNAERDLKDVNAQVTMLRSNIKTTSAEANTKFIKIIGELQHLRSYIEQSANETGKGYSADYQPTTHKPSTTRSQIPSITTVNHTSPGGYSYIPLINDVTNVSWVTFRVQACRDAHLSLQPNLVTITHNAYEFAIGAGSNNFVSLRRPLLQGPNLVLVWGHYLNCSTPKPMWVSWTAGNILFGTGNDLGQNVVINFTDANMYTVKTIALSSYDRIAIDWSVSIPGPN